MDMTNDVFQFDCVMLDSSADNADETLSIKATLPPLLIGGRYLDDDDAPNPPHGIIAAIINVPSTIGHAEVCSNDAHTISTCRING